MYQNELAKAKTAAKLMTYDKEDLKKIVLDTVKEASDIVGSTLGPNGRVVLIERQENLPPYVTKDGISVFNAMAFENPTAQAILEAARDAAAKTNTEAGDSTTTATVLAEALIRRGFNYLEQNPKLSTQSVMRELEKAYKDLVTPFIKANSVKIKPDDTEDLLRKVSMIATNSDKEMTDAVVDAFNQVGHNGNITISEESGPSGYAIDKINGFPIARGFEDSCGRFLEDFINDRPNYRAVLDKPRFILYHGVINEIGTIINILQKIAGEAIPEDMNEVPDMSPNIVIVAHGFSETMLAFFSKNFKNEQSLNMIPLKTPLSPQANGQYHFLMDLAAFTGAKVFDPLTMPLQNAETSDLGLKSMARFEFNRYRSLITGDPTEEALFPRIEELEQQVKNAESEADKEIIGERLAILSGGIAKIKVVGSSEAEIKEKKARVEDAVCAVKGALRAGVLPGGARTLLILGHKILTGNYSKAVKKIMGMAFYEPIRRILENGGYSEGEISVVLLRHENESDFMTTYNTLTNEFGNAIDMGVVDSAEAVGMAIKNSLSVAKMLMGLSAVIVFKRDYAEDLKRSEDYEETQKNIKQSENEELKARFSQDE